MLILYRVGRAAFTLPLRALFHCRVEGREHEPARGPLIVCANHISWWDPPLVGMGLRRQVRFMAKGELFAFPVLGRLLLGVGAFPVHRGRGDRQALVTALAHLEQGRVIGLFLEGTRSRSGQMLDARPGAAWLAVRSRAPILPVAISGKYRPFGGVRMRIGEPFELEEYYDQKVKSNDLAEAGQRIMERIRQLLA